MARRRSLLRETPFALLAPVAALVAYLPVVVVPYAYMDDYFVLAWREGLGGEFFKTATSFGRPLHALSLRGGFSLATDIESLRLVRILSLLGVMVLAMLLYYALRRARYDAWIAVGVCVSVVTLASFQVYVSWASVFEAPYVAVLAGLAWLRLQSSHGLRRAVEGGALLLCALLTYQPAAMFFWVFAAIDVLRPGQPLGKAARTFARGLATGAVAMFFAYAAVRIGVHFYGGAFSGRTNLVHDFVGKARWFWNEPIVNALALFGLVPAVSVALALLMVMAAGIVLLHTGAGVRDAFGFLGLAVCLVPLSYLPNLAVSEQFASYRSLGALASLLALYLWLGILGIGRAPRAALLPVAALLSFVVVGLVVLPLARPEESPSLETIVGWPELGVVAAVFVAAAVALHPRVRRSAAVRAVGLGAFVVAAVLIAARNVTTLVIKPQTTELALLRSELAEPRTRAARRIVFIKPHVSQGAAPLVRYDEFGPPSTYFAWVPPPAVILVWRERSQRARPLEVLAWDQASDATGNAVVDMRKLRERRVGWSVWTFAAAAGVRPSARRP